MIKNFDKKKLISLGIDELKSDLIEFLIKNEQLDKFDENEHFYYWFTKRDRVLKNWFKFVNKDTNEEYIYSEDGKDFNLNSFDGIAQFVIHKKNFIDIDNFFNSNLSFDKTEYFLRYSKKFKRLEYFYYHHYIALNRKKTNCFINHKKVKFFSINEKNFVLFYVNNRMPRYVSNKNAPFLRPFVSYNYPYGKVYDPKINNYENYIYSLNRRLLSIHQKNNIYNDVNFTRIALTLHNIPNKLMLNANNLDEVLSKITKNRHVPKVLLDKFEKEQIIYLYNIIEYDEVDKIIKFIYENIEIYNRSSENYKNVNGFNNNLTMADIIRDFYLLRFGMIQKNPVDKCFEALDNNCHRDQFYLNDYIRMNIENNRKLNLKIKSFKRLCNEHDELIRTINLKNMPELKVNRKFPNIKSTSNFEVEKILDKKRLFSESEIQKHCVKTYGNMINSGRSCIYSILDINTGLRFTLEVCKVSDKNKKVIFYVNQLKGKFNSNPNQETLVNIINLIEPYNVFKNKPDLKTSSGFEGQAIRNNDFRDDLDLFEDVDLNANPILPF